jgi:U11-48K-like CHHC zinc finger
MSELLHCPYDKTHKVTHDKFIWHVTKCAGKNKNHSSLECPYNPLHFINPEEYNLHVSQECPERPTGKEIEKINEYNQLSHKPAPDYKPHPDRPQKYKKESLKAPEEDHPSNVEIESVPRGGGEGFKLNKLSVKPSEEELKKKEQEQKKKKDCDSQIF